MEDVIYLRKANFSTDKETIMFMAGYIENQVVIQFKKFKINI